MEIFVAIEFRIFLSSCLMSEGVKDKVYAAFSCYFV
jgi:hypothetical protein